ncbi:MAG: hypothetical protein C0504_07420 [Candidatus Solibacter sp.]|nr:hypothetical protein [Candidatus Solibacter sp.]
MNFTWLDALGWTATAAFALSYAFRDPASLRKVQALAAMLWIGYGLAIQSMPVVASNLIVAALAVVSMLARKQAEAAPRG